MDSILGWSESWSSVLLVLCCSGVHINLYECRGWQDIFLQSRWQFGTVQQFIEGAAKRQGIGYMAMTMTTIVTVAIWASKTRTACCVCVCICFHLSAKFLLAIFGSSKELGFWSPQILNTPCTLPSVFRHRCLCIYKIQIDMTHLGKPEQSENTQICHSGCKIY